ncbi:hypothetical protein AB3N02_21755 [Priestia aryabhattai]|uniref:hypothetical protein n=1 Tax=Priestia aryabhattai TaxID=412384 RepID=UPI0039A304B6
MVTLAICSGIVFVFGVIMAIMAFGRYDDWGLVLLIVGAVFMLGGFISGVVALDSIEKDNAEKEYIEYCEDIDGHYGIIGHEWNGESFDKIYGCLKGEQK